MKVVLNNVALVIHLCDDNWYVWRRVCVKISQNCCKLLIIPSTKCMFTILFHYIAVRMRRVCYAGGCYKLWLEILQASE